MLCGTLLLPALTSHVPAFATSASSRRIAPASFDVGALEPQLDYFADDCGVSFAGAGGGARTIAAGVSSAATREGRDIENVYGDDEDIVLVDDSSASLAADQFSVGTPSRGGTRAWINSPAPPAAGIDAGAGAGAAQFAPPPAAGIDAGAGAAQFAPPPFPWAAHAPPLVVSSVQALSRLGVVPFAEASVARTARRSHVVLRSFDSERGGAAACNAAASIDTASDESDGCFAANEDSGTGVSSREPNISQSSGLLGTSAMVIDALALELAVPLSSSSLITWGAASGVRKHFLRLLFLLLPPTVTQWLSYVVSYVLTPRIAALLSPASQAMLQAIATAPPWAQRSLGAALLHEIEGFNRAGAIGRCAVVRVDASEIDGSREAQSLVMGLASLKSAGLLRSSATSSQLSSVVWCAAPDGRGAAFFFIRIDTLRALLPRSLVQMTRDALTLTLAPRPGPSALSDAVRLMVLCLAGVIASARPDAPRQAPFALFSGVIPWLQFRSANAWLTSIVRVIDLGAPWGSAAVTMSGAGVRKRRRAGFEEEEDDDEGTDDQIMAFFRLPAVQALCALVRTVRRLVGQVVRPSNEKSQPALAAFEWVGMNVGSPSSSSKLPSGADSHTALWGPDPRETADIVSQREGRARNPKSGLSSSTGTKQPAYALPFGSPAVRVGGFGGACSSGLVAGAEGDEWVAARTSAVSAYVEGLRMAATAYLWHARWLRLLRTEDFNIPGSAHWTLDSLKRGRDTAERSVFTESAPLLVLEALQLLFFITQLPWSPSRAHYALSDASGTARVRLWSWSRLLSTAANIGAGRLRDDLIAAAQDDTFLASLPRENVPSCVTNARLSPRQGGGDAVAAQSSQSSGEEERAAAQEPRLSIAVPVINVRALRWPGNVSTIRLSVQHASAPPPSAREAGDDVPPRERGGADASAMLRRSGASRELMRESRHAVGASSSAPVFDAGLLSRGRNRSYYVCSAGAPSVVERLACEALVHSKPLRDACLVPSRDSRVVFSEDGRGGVSEAASAVSSVNAFSWPTGLWASAAGRAARSAVKPGSAGVAYGDPNFLVESFPALGARGVSWCARPHGVLQNGDIRVKDSGLGVLAEAWEGGEAQRLWRAAHTENVVWSLLFAALLHSEIVGGDSASPAVIEATWKHPWQSAPLDLSEDGGGSTCPSRQTAISVRLRALARASRCAVGAAALAGARAQVGRALLRNRGDTFTPEHLAEIAHAAGGQLLARIFERLSADLSTHAVGFPDVCLWSAPPCCIFSPVAATLAALRTGEAAPIAPQRPPPAEDEPCFALVEVKSDKDRMQASQLAFFNALAPSSSAVPLPIVVLRIKSEPYLEPNN